MVIQLAESKIAEMKEKIGDKKVLLALSGGVDSSVSGVLLHKAIGANLTCVFVDTGLMRYKEGDHVEELFARQYGANFIRINAKDRFLAKLKGITDPEEKRKVIGEEFVRIFEEEAKKIGHVDYFAQGTIYPDVLESGTETSELIKSHHNVGGLPDVVDFEEIIEPLRELFKEDVRALGDSLGMPQNIVYRQPFPGPGLAVRILGEVTDEKIEILRKADHIVTTEIENADMGKTVWQYFAILTNSLAVGIVDDKRTYGNVIAVRVVGSENAITATWTKVPYHVLDIISKRITTEIREVTRVVCDITNKPPGTIEWE